VHQPSDEPRPLRWSYRRIAMTYLLLAAGLLPWLVLLAVALPDREVNHNYRLAWVGFDVMLLFALSRTAWLAWRRSPFLVNIASVTATMLVIDAWFDITSSGSAHERWLAVVTAAFVELPLAAFSIRLARQAQKLIVNGRRPPPPN
jgi:hypothetical protein